MKTVYVITMWSGGAAAKKWKSLEPPEPLPQGTGVSFTNSETRLKVEVIGSISIEQYESGKEEFESRVSRRTPEAQRETPLPPDAPAKDSNIKKFTRDE